jgi:hypothetical protein
MIASFINDYNSDNEENYEPSSSENNKNYFSDEEEHFEEDNLDEDPLEEDEEDCRIVEGTSKRKKKIGCI